MWRSTPPASVPLARLFKYSHVSFFLTDPKPQDSDLPAAVGAMKTITGLFCMCVCLTCSAGGVRGRELQSPRRLRGQMEEVKRRSEQTMNSDWPVRLTSA